MTKKCYYFEVYINTYHWIKEKIGRVKNKKNVTSDELWKEIAIEGIIKIKKGVRKKGCE